MAVERGDDVEKNEEGASCIDDAGLSPVVAVAPVHAAVTRVCNSEHPRSIGCSTVMKRG